MRRVVGKRSAAGGVQLAAVRLCVPGPEDQAGGDRQRRVHTSQQFATGSGGVEGQAVHHGAPMEGRSGVHA